MFLFLFLTFAAGPGELQLVAGDRAAGEAFRLRDGRGCELDALQIHHTSAVGADEMGVGCGVVVVTLQPIHHADGLDAAVLLEHGDVPVDGTQAQVRDLRLQLLIDPFSAGVALGPTDAVENGITLSAVLSGSFHVSLQSNSIIILIVISS